ncbi:hypothetical protein BDY17DRAFT_302003 [Neohortaea acidophila]|uniref:Uncharacterized protein n=1 Tax=Neohortaea acidophila TaxID=245834 RepID=A0A6A6PLL9_9PEZI|nr:uncharacterized protein BDY17DRAFT_302003 [Neohortaea acidophila]KAF2480554.1 hypothetical protein BDY17DRAFT_302003 [Neohortaea acidophila]
MRISKNMRLVNDDNDTWPVPECPVALTHCCPISLLALHSSASSECKATCTILLARSLRTRPTIFPPTSLNEAFCRSRTRYAVHSTFMRTAKPSASGRGELLLLSRSVAYDNRLVEDCPYRKSDLTRLLLNHDPRTAGNVQLIIALNFTFHSERS